MMQQRATVTPEAFDAINRQRRLTDAEVLRLERALRRSGCSKQRFWTKREVDRLRRYLLRGKKPAEIQHLLSRTERSIWRMIYRQGWTVGAFANECAIAVPRQSVRGR